MLSTRLLLGNAGASANPNASRVPTSDASPDARPVAIVHNDQRVTDKKYVSRTPIRSSRIPPGICAAAYVHPNAESAIPMSAGVRSRSSLSSGAVTLITVRSR